MNAMNIKHINAAEMFVSSEPTVISTVLGSCISVCLYCPQKEMGGMIHYALPSPDYGPTEKNPEHKNSDLRYGNLAIQKLIQSLEKITGLSCEKFVAKIVGGGAVMDELKQSSSIGPLNAAMARDMLKARKISIIGEDVGGTSGRKVYFYSDSGRLRVSLLNENYKNQKPPIASPKKRVLIVDDSSTICELLKRVLSRDPALEVVGSASNPTLIPDLVKKLRPDVITLDIHMPEMTGIEYLRRLHPAVRLPVVMITSVNKEESSDIFQALELGAIDYIQKPSLQDLNEMGDLICEKVKVAASTQNLVHRARDKFQVRGRVSAEKFHSNTLLAIGASTGGTEALKDVLTRLPKEVPPILIVQHIPPVFSAAFAKRLNDLCLFDVKEAEDGDEVRPGLALVAPGGYHMRLKKTSRGNIVTLDQLPPVQRHRPSVDVMFESVAREHVGPLIGVILTGMGSDGARGMLELHQKGAQTIAQNEESCVVFGMPKEAIRMGGVDVITHLSEVPEKIMIALNKTQGNKRLKTS